MMDLYVVIGYSEDGCSDYVTYSSISLIGIFTSEESAELAGEKFMEEVSSVFFKIEEVQMIQNYSLISEDQ